MNPGHIAKEDDMYQAAQAGPGAVLNERKKPDADKLFQLLASAGMLPSPNL